MSKCKKIITSRQPESQAYKEFQVSQEQLAQAPFKNMTRPKQEM